MSQFHRPNRVVSACFRCHRSNYAVSLPAFTYSTLLAVMIFAHVLRDSVAWTPPSHFSACASKESKNDVFFSIGSQRRISRLHLASDRDNGDDPLLDEVDARVLQSMLQDEKLNLQEEDNMKRLLERGIKTKEPVAQEAKRAQEEVSSKGEEEYASQLFQTLGSTKLWKGLSRNAADLFESAKIWVENKVERDAKLVAGLGFFAFERALSDVKRALPATASFVDNVAPKRFLLDATSSADQRKNDIRSQMATPEDEIKSVAQEIKLIIQSGGDQRSTGPAQRRLQSTATSKQGKDRFLKAYQRRKDTTLKREQENFAQSSARMAGNVLDSAYQVKRELEVEPNQPGYKTKAIREGAAETSRMLASGAAGFLSGAKAAAQKALTDGTSLQPPGRLPFAETPNTFNNDRNVEGGMAATDAAMNAAIPKMSPPETFIDATVVGLSSEWSNADAPINTRIPGTSSPNNQQFDDFQAAGKERNDMYIDSLNQAEEELEQEFFFATTEVVTADEPNTRRKPFFTEQTQEVEQQWYVDATLEAAADGGGFGGIPPNQGDSYVSVVSDDSDEMDEFPLEEDPEEALRKVMAEIVFDDEMEGKFGQAKQVQEVSEFDEAESKPGIWTQLSLRVLDVLFLVLEKILLTIPSVVSAIPRIATRLAVVQTDGLGTEGWETISNAQRGTRRY